MRIVFLTGSRADYGKLKALMRASQEVHDVQVFVTGMHLSKTHGETWTEIRNDGFSFVKASNDANGMDNMLAKTIEQFSRYVNLLRPDMIVVHGDRGEALAGAIVGAMNNIIVCHVEGGDLSGSVDEHLRHAISKLSHVHCVTNERAAGILRQLGEKDIHVIGSPDLDLMFSDLPALWEVFDRYDIHFSNYGILLYHPVTTAPFKSEIETLVTELIKSKEKLVVIYPNNDHGYELILEEYKRFPDDQVKLLPSMRFECFLSLLQKAKFIVGNSSCGIMEAPYYGTPAINIGSRQARRGYSDGVDCDASEVRKHLNQDRTRPVVISHANSAKRFLQAIAEPREVQKTFHAVDC